MLDRAEEKTLETERVDQHRETGETGAAEGRRDERKVPRRNSERHEVSQRGCLFIHFIRFFYKKIFGCATS